MSAPLVSVIIPAFNKAQYIGETVDSVLGQTFGDFEIIIVNDGSTDSTRRVLDEVASAHPRRSIRIIHKTNAGVSEARNTAVATARGRYITAIDADDLMLPHYLERAVGALERGEGNLAACHVELFGEGSGEWVPADFEVYAERYNNNIPTLVTYRRELWEMAGGYKRAFPFNEDWDFFVSLEPHGLKVAQLREKLMRYRVTEGGLAERYIKDTWPFSFSLIATSNESRYPVQRVIGAHQQLMSMPERWIERFMQQDALHPNEWLLKFWLGLVLRSRNQIEQAKALFVQSIQMTDTRNWQPLFQLAEILGAQGDRDTAAALYHQCRIVRPDTELLVEEKLR